MDLWELVSEIDTSIISVVFEVVPQAVIEGNWVGSFLFRRGEDKEVVSLSIVRVIGRNARDMRVLCLWGIWFKVCYLALVKPMDGFFFFSFL